MNIDDLLYEPPTFEEVGFFHDATGLYGGIYSDTYWGRYLGPF